MQQKYDYYLIGPISIDTEQFYDGTSKKLIGGALPFGAYAALAGNRKIGALAKIGADDQYITDLLYIKNLTVIPSKRTPSYHLTYQSENREHRTISVASACDCFLTSDIPDAEAEIYHLAGLSYGDFDHELFPFLASRGKLACDLQGFLRHPINGKLEFEDWPEKFTYIPYVTYLKADAAEAEIITGRSDRRDAAEQLYQWGAKEVLITHNTEVLVYDGTSFYTCPIRARSLIGRSGRGDTTFSSYITERIDHAIPDALFYATSLVSLKMESTGPFRGTRSDVEAYQQDIYSDYIN